MKLTLHKSPWLNVLMLVCTMLIGNVSGAWAETVTYSLTPDKTSTGSSSTSYITTLTEFTYNDISWKMNQWNPSTLQVKTNQASPTSEFRFYNTTAFPGRITQVTVHFSALTPLNSDFSGFMFLGGTSPVTATTGGTNGTFNNETKIFTWTPAADDNYTYFAFYQYGKVASGTNKLSDSDAIVVTYEAPSTTSCSSPTITGTTPFLQSTEVSISCATEGAAIQYSTDGTTWADYTTPFTLTETTTVQAKATKEGFDDSEVTSKEFVKTTPYTVAEARAAIDAGTGVTGVYATGIVSAIPTAYSTDFGNITFNIVDATGDTEYLQAYRCTGDEAANVAIGDIVVVYGNLTKYNSTYEFGQGCQLISRTAAPVAQPTFSPEEGAYTETQSVTIACETEGAIIYYTLDGTEPTSASTQYTGAITVSETTTIKAIAINGEDESAVVEATYTITQPSTIAEARAQSTGNVFTKGIVTSVSGKNVYIQDATAAILVYGNANITDLSIGDEITVSGTLTTYNELLEIKNPTYDIISSGNAVTPTVKTISEINTDYAGGNALQGWLVKIEEATVTVISDKNVTISQGENTIVVRFNEAPSGFDVNDKLTLTGNIGCFNAVQIANPTDITVHESEEPNITVSTTSVNAEAIETDGTITVTYNNITNVDAELKIVESDGITEATYDWLAAELDESNNISYLISANTGETRTAYLKVYALDDDANEVYSDLITITQAAYVEPTKDYAELPFEWEGGVGSDLTALTGVTAYGLGSDYAEINAPYRVKLDGDGDYIQVKTNERPGIVTIGVKMLGGGNTSYITVQESADGETFSDVQQLTISGSQNDILTLSTNTAFAETSRYVRLIFTKGSNIGVGPITIAQYADIVLNDYTLTLGNPENVTITATYDEEVLNNGDNAEVTEGTEVTLAVTPAEGFDIESVTVAGEEEGQRVALTEDPSTSGVYTFTMPAFAVTVNATVVEHVEPSYSTYTLATSITSGKQYIIASSAEDGDAFAMGEQKTNNRGAGSITITDGTASVASNAGVYEFVITGDDTSGYTIYDESAESTGYLYAASSSANQLKTQTEYDVNGIWTITINEDDEASIVATGSNNRNVMQFNENNGSPLFSCYASASQSPVYLYEKNDEEAPITDDDIFVKVTDEKQLAPGNKFVVIAYNGNPGDQQGDYAFAYEEGSAKGIKVRESESSTVVVDKGTQVFTLGGGENAYSLKSDDGYLTYVSGENPSIATDEYSLLNIVKVDATAYSPVCFKVLNKDGAQLSMNYGNTYLWDNSWGAARLYVNKNHELLTLLGDVNKDGSITIADVTALVNIILGKDTEGQYDHKAADVNTDGSVTIADVTALVNIILGKTTTN